MNIPFSRLPRQVGENTGKPYLAGGTFKSYKMNPTLEEVDHGACSGYR